MADTSIQLWEKDFCFPRPVCVTLARHFLLLFLYVSPPFAPVPPVQLTSSPPPPTPIDFWIPVIRTEACLRQSRYV